MKKDQERICWLLRMNDNGVEKKKKEKKNELVEDGSRRRSFGGIEKSCAR
jgi:hypothetical protein